MKNRRIETKARLSPKNKREPEGLDEIYKQFIREHWGPYLERILKTTQPMRVNHQKYWSRDGQRILATKACKTFNEEFNLEALVNNRGKLAIKIVIAILLLDVMKSRIVDWGTPYISCRRAIRRILGRYDSTGKEAIPREDFLYSLTYAAIGEFVRHPRLASNRDSHSQELSDFWDIPLVDTVPFDENRLSDNGYKSVKKGKRKVIDHEELDGGFCDI